MTTIEYQTSGGNKRVIKDLIRLPNNKSNTATRWASADGKKTYEWYWQGAIDGRLHDDVMRVNSDRSCSRLLGLNARHIE